jgi:hypothetical protein
MTSSAKTGFGRRQLFRILGAGAAAGAIAPLATEADADNESNDEKRRARYQANSDDIKNFYRVNRYPS